ncbi:unnamed protein product [Polarella glacialis]|uniref:SHOCT domain-containing protein n=1 Tax=Polarella glacialis TaxID=89957 RepID=A0A813ICJ7_POLGL|nr:unnamed protein product [Polarella glacialis]
MALGSASSVSRSKKRWCKENRCSCLELGGKSQTQTLVFNRGPDGILYCDAQGSIIQEMQEFQVIFDNALGYKLLWRRSDAYQASKQQSSAASGAASLAAQGQSSKVEKLKELKELMDDGVLTQSEFQVAKTEVLNSSLLYSILRALFATESRNLHVVCVRSHLFHSSCNCRVLTTYVCVHYSWALAGPIAICPRVVCQGFHYLWLIIF